jgi:hypothetical protein
MPPLDPAMLPLVNYPSHKVDAPGAYFKQFASIYFPILISHVIDILLQMATSLCWFP